LIPTRQPFENDSGGAARTSPAGRPPHPVFGSDGICKSWQFAEERLLAIPGPAEGRSPDSI
jgi:hypothetical protein